MEKVLDERGRSEEGYPVEMVVGTVVLTDGDDVELGEADGDGDGVVATIDDDDGEGELPPAVPEAVPPRLK